MLVAGGTGCTRAGGGAVVDASRAESASAWIAEVHDAAVERTAPNRLSDTLMAEIQAAVDRGGDPARMGQIIASYAAQPEALMARKTALYVLKSFPSRPARLAALLEGGSATPVPPEDDPLWREVVGVLSETWARENIAEGRRRMLREARPRARRLLVSSIAIYAGSNRGLSDLPMPARRALRAELQRLYPGLPPEQRRDIDAALPPLAHEVSQKPPAVP